MNILVVDDNESIVNLLEEILSKSGFHSVTTALGGKEAIDLIASAEQPFDCFVVDIQMPDVDGIELTRVIRKDPRHEFTPIIILTAMHQKSYLDRAFAAGATDYATKPFDFAELRALIQSARKLSAEKARTNKPLTEGSEGADLPRLNLSDAIALKNVEGALAYAEFENYVAQLAKKRLTKTALFGVRVNGIEWWHKNLTSVAFAEFMSEIGRVIKDVLVRPGGVLSYQGNGIFLVANSMRLLSQTHNCEKKLNEELADRFARKSESVPPRLVVGEHVNLGALSRADALDSLAAAIARVDGTGSSAQQPKQVSHRAFFKSASFQEKSRIEQRSYEALLRDAMSTDTHDAWSRVLSRKSRQLYEHKGAVPTKSSVNSG